MRSRSLCVPLLAALTAALLGVTAVPAGAREARPVEDQYDEVEVSMVDNDFVPQTITVDPGTLVRWTNNGRTSHNVIPDDKAAGWSSESIKPGKSFERRFDTPGVYGYFCSFHGAPGTRMYGTVIVKNPDGSVPEAAKARAPAPRASGKPRTIRVPKNAKTIQAAVDKAAPGDLILVSPGVYNEAVTVTTDRLVLRGLDRNKVILDGKFELDNGVKVLGADGVAVENMTARNYQVNGFFWTGSTGYRGSYLTSTRTGDYGIYAFDSTDGIFERSYASGAPDAGYYIGQCYPCNALITNVIAEWNGLGYSGTNAGGNLIITKSIWKKNRAGIVPNSGDGELNPPERETTVVGNLVYDNNNGKTPAIDAARLAQYNGILIAGGIDNLVLRNRVYDHDIAGIAAVLNPDKTVWFASGNRVEGNVVSRSGEADLAAAGGERNCFAGNRFETSKPSNIEQVLPCEGAGVPATDSLDLQKFIDAEKPESVDYRRAKTPKPPKLPGMRRPATAKARPAVGIVIDVDVDTIGVPTLKGLSRKVG